MEIKLVRTSAEILLIIGLMVSVGVIVNDEDEGYIPYTCELETVDDYMCYKLSKVGTTGVNRNCYYDRDNSRKYKVCSTGWKRITNIDDYKPVASDCPTVNVISYVSNDDCTGVDKWFCKGIGQTQDCKEDGGLGMPFW